MANKIWKPKFKAGHGVEKTLEAIRNPSEPVAIQSPPEEIQALLKADVGGDGFTLSSFTAQDAFELGHLLHARLLPFAPTRSAVIHISLASGTVLYHSVTGSGTQPDNDEWIARKRNVVLRFGVSSWYMGRKFKGDEGTFASKFSLSPDKAGQYAIHGGGVPIRVKGADGVVAVVVVSGLQQQEDHGVIAEVIREHWEPVEA